MPEREKVISGLETCLDDNIPCDECPYKKSCCGINDERIGEMLMRDSLALLKEQEQIKEESITPFEVLEIISSSYGGKQIFFQEENGMIYDRYKCEYITLEDAVYRMAKMVGDNGDA